MLVTFVDTLSVPSTSSSGVSARSCSPRAAAVQFTETSPRACRGTRPPETAPPGGRSSSTSNNGQEAYLKPARRQPGHLLSAANGGFSVGTQGVDFFRRRHGRLPVSSLVSPTGAIPWRIRSPRSRRGRSRPPGADRKAPLPADRRWPGCRRAGLRYASCRCCRRRG